MSAAKHTPGPWRVVKRSGAPTGLDILCGGNRVAAVNGGLPREEAREAALIAAAPDLLAALVDALERCKFLGERCAASVRVPVSAEQDDALERYRAAIAKARGQS